MYMDTARIAKLKNLDFIHLDMERGAGQRERRSGTYLGLTCGFHIFNLFEVSSWLGT